jgi:hypothetical protein
MQALVLTCPYCHRDVICYTRPGMTIVGKCSECEGLTIISQRCIYPLDKNIIEQGNRSEIETHLLLTCPHLTSLDISNLINGICKTRPVLYTIGAKYCNNFSIQLN